MTVDTTGPDVAPAVTIRAATAGDLDGVKRLLTSAKLPLDGLEEQFAAGYAIAEYAGEAVGAAGVERYGDAGLLRSAVVDPGWRGRGVGEALTRDRLRWAGEQRLRQVWLLTTTAAEYFPRFGFVRADRDQAPAAMQASREFAEACPASAVAMRLDVA